MLPALAPPGRSPAGPGRAQRATRHGTSWRRPVPGCSSPASTCACPSSRSGRARRRCGSSSTPCRRPPSARTSSRTCAGRRSSTTSSSPPPTSPAWPRKRVRSIRSGSRWIAVDRADLNAAAAALAERETKQQLSGAEMLRFALGLEDSPLAGGISIDGGRLGRRPARRRSRCRGRTGARRRRDSSASSAATRPKRSRGSASSMPPGSAAASRSTWASGKTPTLLAHLLAGDGRRPRAGDRAARRRRQLDRGSRALHPDAASQRAPRREPRRARRDRGAGRRTPTSSSRPTAPRCATSKRSPGIEWARVVLDEAQVIKNPANDTSQQLRRIPARSRARAHRARRSRTASATSGPSSTSSTPGSSATGRSSSPVSRATAARRASKPRTRCAR